MDSVDFDQYESRLAVFENALAKTLHITDTVIALGNLTGRDLDKLNIEDVEIQQEIIKVADECCNFVNILRCADWKLHNWKLNARVLSIAPVGLVEEK